MFKNYFLLNLLLILVILFLVIRLHAVVTTDLRLPAEAAASSPLETDRISETNTAAASASSYDVITSGNLFHPSRSTAGKPSETQKPVSKNELPQLFGTIIMNEKKLAILEDMASKRSNLYEVNDPVSGFIVSQILENKVILKKNGEFVEIGLRADKEFKPPKRIPARKRAIRKATKRRRPANRARRNRPLRRRIPAGGSSG